MRLGQNPNFHRFFYGFPYLVNYLQEDLYYPLVADKNELLRLFPAQLSTSQLLNSLVRDSECSFPVLYTYLKKVRLKTIFLGTKEEIDGNSMAMSSEDYKLKLKKMSREVKYHLEILFLVK